MRILLKITVILILVTITVSCISKTYPIKYSIYKGDKTINFPKNKIEISLLNDSVGVFKNFLKSDEVFIQKFNYSISNNAFLHITNLDTINKNIVSLNNKDTISIYKSKMFYLYNGEKKYLLYFRKN